MPNALQKLTVKLADLLAHHPYLAVAFLALWIAAAGTARIPLNGHEVYVAETAREMQERGDWLVPYFNGQLRLNKPPLNYWLTGAVAWLAGQQPIQDWHARAVSALAAAGLALLTLTLGRRLYSDQRIGMLGGLLLISSLGFFTYSHDARPEMLYALCCMAAYTALAEAWRRRQQNRNSAIPAYAMWLAFALATLAKGPHLPAILLAGSAGFLRWHERQSWRAIGELLRPLSGFLLAAAVAGPWWWWLRRHIGADTLSHSQLGGALLTVDWRQVLNPYHLVRILQLLLPWSLLLPFALGLAWRRRLLGRESLWLVALIAVAAVILGFGSQRRWFYMLPLLPALCLLLAEMLVKLVDDGGRRRWLANLNAGLWLLVAAGGVLLFFRPGCCDGGHWPQLAAAVTVAVAWQAVLILRRRRSMDPWPEMSGSPLALAAMLALLGDSPALWGPDRYYVKEAIETAAPHIDVDTPVVSLGDSPMACIFYLQRTVTRMDSLEGLSETLVRARRPVLAIVDNGRAGELPAAWMPRRLAAMPNDAEEPKTFVLLQPPTPTHSP